MTSWPAVMPPAADVVSTHRRRAEDVDCFRDTRNLHLQRKRDCLIDGTFHVRGCSTVLKT